jgi:hypothetical protein
MKLAATAFALLAAVAACGGSRKKAPEGPAPDDVPQEVTCCMEPSTDGMDHREVKPVEKCPEEQRNPVEDCNVGPGDAEPTN